MSKVGSEWEEPKCTVGAGCALVYFVYGRRMEGKKAGLGGGGACGPEHIQMIIGRSQGDRGP